MNTSLKALSYILMMLPCIFFGARDLYSFDRPPRKTPFDFERLITKAEALAKEPFKEESEEKTPEFLRSIGYDQWSDIRYRKGKRLWHNQGLFFEIDFFHPGFIYNRKVMINEVDDQGIHPVKFASAQFDYGKTGLEGKVSEDLDFSGLRIRFSSAKKHFFDEVAVFLGASYFRAVGRYQRYGISARGLAVNTALQDAEEFPYFKEFWLIRPKRGEKKLTLYGLMDSQSVTGAYKFIITPGIKTIMKVECALFMRKAVKKLGIAPISSMFFYGEHSGYFNDFRPEVHDSDGALIESSSGEWIWRPLLNPKRLSINVFNSGTPRGFGLLQRDSNFDHYLDLESRYDKRPSLWVIPDSPWGKGRLELVQIPSENEYNDNITFFWVPESGQNPGEALKFAYYLQWYPSEEEKSPNGYVVSTRLQRFPQKNEARIILDFLGKALESLPEQSKLLADISVAKPARLVEYQIQKNPVSRGWRLSFLLRIATEDFIREKFFPGTLQPIELRAFLKEGEHILSETWSYLFQP